MCLVLAMPSLHRQQAEPAKGTCNTAGQAFPITSDAQAGNGRAGTSVAQQSCRASEQTCLGVTAFW